MGPKIMPPKSLDGDSARVPKVSRASDGKGPFDEFGTSAFQNKELLCYHCGIYFVLRMRNKEYVERKSGDHRSYPEIVLNRPEIPNLSFPAVAFLGLSIVRRII